MKKRYLRKEIEIALSIITMLLVMFFGMLDDFELSAIPFLFAAMAVLVFNVCVLTKYGKGVLYDGTQL